MLVVAGSWHVVGRDHGCAWGAGKLAASQDLATWDRQQHWAVWGSTWACKKYHLVTNVEWSKRHFTLYSRCVICDYATLDIEPPGYHQVVLVLDSLEAIRVLKDDFIDFHSLKWHLDELIGRDWSVHIQHTKCSGNKVADALAKNANLASLATTFYVTPPIWINSLLLENVEHH
ncbi:hypothetical protein V6N12_009858 [Hibiscus sabdariffa]|uniref:RNase H type-1 domain-containing protein n=1 Tax=Hibiscus sabdariffa TaxID=183260 RepID=A0ABR2EBY6_9ROSI